MAEPYYADYLVTLHLGDCLGVMAAMPDASVDAVVCDPPYGLAEIGPKVVIEALAAWLGGDRMHVPDGRGFMGRAWDKFVPPPGVWDECLRVLKPGGWLLAFAAPRTADLMGMSIRLAGFSLTDSLHWVTGQGFPKAKSRLKPAHEPIVMARKPAKADSPLPGLDACRVATAPEDAAAMERANTPGSGRMKRGGSPIGTFIRSNPTGAMDTTAGRWPPNLLLVHSASCNGTCAPGCPVAGLDGQSGITRDGTHGRAPGGFDYSGQGATYGGRGKEGFDASGGYGGSGGASRFFPQFTWDPEHDLPFMYCAKAPKSERPTMPKKPAMRLRPDLSDEDRAYVLSELRKAGLDVA